MPSASDEPAIGQWVEASLVLTDPLQIEIATALLEPFAADGVVVCEQLGDPNDPAPRALAPETNVKAYLEPAADLAEVQLEIGRTFRANGLAAPRFSAIDSVDWSSAWRDHFQPLQVGRRLWIRPSWRELDREIGAGSVVITLDPGMAFGTGTHATTQLCLEILEESVRREDTVLDVGTGSGILAIAAAMLGASAVKAIDNDPQAVSAATENVRLNGVADRVSVQANAQADLPAGRWDVVVVNILAPVIGTLLAAGLSDRVAPAGVLILSGILAEQYPTLDARLSGLGWETIRLKQKGDWVGALLRRSAPQQ